MTVFPKVSIVIPLYNQKKYVGEAIDSILNQTYPNIETIVVNDGSEDDPMSVLNNYKKKIKLINQENKGLSSARNIGIKQCTGEYIQLLDADDFLHKDKIRLQLEFTESQKATISYCEVVQYDTYLKKTYLRYIGEVKDMFPELYNFWPSYPLPVHSLLIKKNIFDEYGLFDENLKACEDRYFFSKLALAGIDFKYFPFIGGYRRSHDSNMNKDKLNIIINTIKYYKKIHNEIDNQFLIKKFGYTGYQMMCANLTFIYRNEIAKGSKWDKIHKIKKFLGKRGVKLNAEPIPLNYKKFKLQGFLITGYMRGWLKKIFPLRNCCE